MKKIAVIGASGMLGWPVTKALADAGFEVTALIRSSKNIRPYPNLNWVEGDLKNPESLQKLLIGKDAVHLNLSVKQTEKETDWHAEEQGLENVLQIARSVNIKRITYLSSLVMHYQGTNNFDWWVFRLKQKAVAQIKIQGCR
jgi:nucleoside-diphosphate-sugar epimerase